MCQRTSKIFTSTVFSYEFFKMKGHLLRVWEWKRLEQKLETLHCICKYLSAPLIFEYFPFLVSTHQLRTRSVFKYHSVFQISAMWQTAICLGKTQSGD